MARQGYVSHAKCEHESTAKARQICRDKRRHSACDHPLTEYAGKMCDKARAQEKE
ncbi:hypothetical protein [Streptomyces ipomoeae]|uniref:hypothetical protein n=1 Tax=Streptomyces ipomoeae TaxID=103232 RepID=UPI0015F07757|nr:hypothetical protein [Streptomyces ipomoeae]